MQTDQNATQAQRFTYYDAIGDNTHIAGVTIGLKWSELEAAQGDYSPGIELITATLKKLKSLPTPKRLFIRMHPMCYGSSCTDAAHLAKYYPGYVVKMGGAGPITSGTLVAFWKPAVNDRYIALMQALAKAFDNDPYFEGIAPIRETSAGPVNGNFTIDALYEQWRRLAAASASAFVKSNVVFFVNGMGGQENVDKFIAYLYPLQVGVGAPDTCGLDLCGEKRLNSVRTLAGLSGGTDYRGKMPIIWSVEGTELGLAKMGPPGGYTAKQIFDIVNSEPRTSHMLWSRIMYTGTAAQKWDPGMLAVINANPLTHTSCPKAYTQGCITD